MRLFLSSYGLGNQPQRLADMIEDNKNVAVIANATDFRDIETRERRVEKEFGALHSLGLEPTEVDLRDYFDGSFTARELEGYSMVWVRGGNVFNLRRAMQYSGFDKIITQLIKEGKIIYAGYSAGACVLSPSLRGIEFCDPVADIPEGYKHEVIWEGLNIIPYAIAPHYDSDHPESPMVDDVVKYMEENHIVYKPLKDGEVIVIEGHEEKLLR